MFNFTRDQITSLILLSLMTVSCKQSLSTTGIFNDLEPVEEIEIMTHESFPVQVSVVARGHLPDNCTVIDDIIEEQTDDTFSFKMITVRQTDKDCSKESQAFEEIIPLDVENRLAGVYVVKVNSVGDSFELGVDNIIP